MGLLNRLFGNEEREYHKDGSTTDRNGVRGTTVTRDKDGNVREYTFENRPFIGPNTVTTYDKDGKKINNQLKK